MDCICRLCKQIVHGPPVIDRGLILSVRDQAERDTSEFDLMAAVMGAHISRFHPAEAAEQISVGWLASKMYAMRYGLSSDPKFAVLKKGWGMAIIDSIRLPEPMETTEAVEVSGGVN
jgi:hypothetical protein